MKVIVALLLVAVASASFSGFIQKLEQDEQKFFNSISNYFKELNISVNATQVALGVNQELNLVTDANGLNCVATVLPTVENLQNVMGTLQNFEFAMTFEFIKPLISSLNSFDSLCQPAYNAYAEYFLDAVEAYQANENVFVHTVLENMLQNKDQTLALAVELSTQIAAKDDTSAGETLAKLIQFALAQWLPQ